LHYTIPSIGDIVILTRARDKCKGFQAKKNKKIFPKKVLTSYAAGGTIFSPSYEHLFDKRLEFAVSQAPNVKADRSSMFYEHYKGVALLRQPLFASFFGFFKME